MELHRVHGMLGTIVMGDHRDVRRSKATVHSIIKNFGGRSSTQAIKPPSRPQKLPKRCHLLILGFIEPPHLTQFRFKRDIMCLVAKNPHWGCKNKKIGEEVYMKLLTAQLVSPRGPCMCGMCGMCGGIRKLCFPYLFRYPHCRPSRPEPGFWPILDLRA